MNKKKIIKILVLVFVLILGGAGILYKQLGQKLAPNLLATQTPQEPNPQKPPLQQHKRMNQKRYWPRILQFTIWMEMKFIFRILSGNPLS